MAECNTLTCQIDGKANPVNPDGSPLRPTAASRSGRDIRSGRAAGPRSGCDGRSSPARTSGLSIPLDPGQPQQPQPQQPPASNMGFAKVPVSLDNRTGFGTGMFGGRPPPADKATPPPAPPPLPVKVPPALTADAPLAPMGVGPLPSVKDLCAQYPALATTVLCRRDREGTLNLAPECLATLRDGLAAGLSLDALRAHERCTSFAELLVPASAAADSSLAMSSPMLDDAAAVKSAGAVADACYQQFLGLSTDVQAGILEDGAHGAYGLCQQAAAMLRNGQTAAARVAVDWLYASFAQQSPVLADFCNAVALAAGLRPSGYAAFASSPMALAAQTPTYSMREWVRPSGNPPTQTVTFTNDTVVRPGSTPAPDPWAGLAGGGLGPAYDPTTGQTFNPTTGQPIGPTQPAAPTPDYSAALAGLGAGATALVGGYLQGEQRINIAQAGANAQIAAANAAAQAARDVATINANRDLAIAQLRGTTDPSAQASLQAQINAMGTALTNAQASLQAQTQASLQAQTPAACPGNLARLSDGTCPPPAPATDNTALFVVGGVVALGVVGGLAYALSGSSGRKNNGRSRVKRSAARTGRRAAARGR